MNIFNLSLPSLKINLSDVPENETPESCISKLRAIRVPPELESADRLVKLAYRYLKNPDITCWSITASDRESEHSFKSMSYETLYDRPSAQGTFKIVIPYPDENSGTVLIRCLSAKEGAHDCLDSFHEESSKQIILCYLLDLALTSLPPDEHIRFARIPRVTNIGFHDNDGLRPFRIDERIDQTALQYIRSIPDQNERQRAFCVILLQVMNTLRVLRDECNFVHGDMKLDNLGVKLSDEGKCVQSYILDFGLSCISWKDINIRSRISPYHAIVNATPVNLLPNDLLFLLSSSITKIRGIFELGCADNDRCVMEKMILFILTTIGTGDMKKPHVVYEPLVFTGERARILSNENVEAIACSLILNYKARACNTLSPSTETRLSRCQLRIERIASDIVRANSPFPPGADERASLTLPGAPQSPVMMSSSRPSNT